MEYIPVVINNKEYSFLFDTAAERSVIKADVADSIGVKCTKDSVSIDGILIKKAPGIFTEPIDINIGGNRMNLPLVSTSTFLNGNPYHGIIGLDVISRFYWLFDLETNLFEVSKKPLIDSVLQQSSRVLLPSTT